MLDNATDDDFDPSEELSETPYTQKDDIYVLGNHRVMCGDATIKENVDKLIQDDYNKNYGELIKRYERMKGKYENLIKSRNIKNTQALNLKSFVANLKRVDDKLEEWKENIWTLLVSSAIVHRDTSITFKLNNGKEIRS